MTRVFVLCLVCSVFVAFFVAGTTTKGTLYSQGNDTEESPPLAVSSTVRKVHVVFSHHLDVGLNEALRFVGFCEGFATKIIQEYFDDFIPRAIKIAKEINIDIDPAVNDGRFAYTIHPWIASLYVDCVPWDVQDGCGLNPGKLRCPSKEQVSVFDDAVERGDLLWADSPMNINAGIVGEPGMFGALFDIAGALNERYNISKPARVWSNVDVPGFTRSSIPLLRSAGASAISVCANVGSPHQGNGSVPVEFVGQHNATMFRWRDPASESEILVLFHRAQRDTMSKIPLQSEFNTYGGFTRLDNMIVSPSGKVALASYVAADNTGPPFLESEVSNVFKAVRSVFPNATTVVGSTWDRFVAELNKDDIAALPQYSSAWGDLWIDGVSNDPGRIAKYRALARARAECIKSRQCNLRDPIVRNFTRFLAKNVEHTQGVEGGAGQPGAQLCIWLSLLGLPCTADKYWRNDLFRKVHTKEKNLFPGADSSWLEARVFNDLAEQAVPPSHPLFYYINREIQAIAPMSKKRRGALTENNIAKCSNTTLEFSKETGCLQTLIFNSSEGTSSWNRLMELRYITYRDESKKGMVCNESTCPNPIAAVWSPSVVGFEMLPCRAIVYLKLNETLHENYGAPSGATVVYDVDPYQRRVNVSLTWHNKTSTRLQEATTVFNRPYRKGSRWEMNKLGEWIPSVNVTEGGNQYQHSVWTGVRYVSLPNLRGLTIHTLDAASACPLLNQVADASLTPSVAMLKSCVGYDIKSTKNQGAQRQLNNSMVDGMGIKLHSNRFTISGFAQWYPFGIGGQFQSQDSEEQFRFVIEET